MYYNTTNEKGSELTASVLNAKSQTEQVLEFFKCHSEFGYSASVVHRILKLNCPLTSIRRAMTNLYKSDLLIKTEEKVIGNYGKPEYKYKIK